MSARPLVLRRLARRDVEDAIDRYAAETGAAVALRFVDALEATYARIAAQPGAGAPGLGHAIGLAGLRTRRVGRFPYLALYVETADRIEV